MSSSLCTKDRSTNLHWSRAALRFPGFIIPAPDPPSHRNVCLIHTWGLRVFMPSFRVVWMLIKTCIHSLKKKNIGLFSRAHRNALMLDQVSDLHHIQRAKSPRTVQTGEAQRGSRRQLVWKSLIRVQLTRADPLKNFSTTCRKLINQFNNPTECFHFCLSWRFQIICLWILWN